VFASSIRDSIDDRGDINLNNIAYEVADAVSLPTTSRASEGVHDQCPGQIAAHGRQRGRSDTHGGGFDLLIRVIIGDALPIHKTTPYPEKLIVSAKQSEGKLTFETNCGRQHRSGVAGV